MSAGRAYIEVNSDHVQAPCRCAKYAQQFQNLGDSDVKPSYVSCISRQEGQLQLAQRMRTAEKNHQALVQMLVSAGDTFFGRWNKSRKKRAAYLVDAFPDRNLVSGDPKRQNPTQNILLVWLKWDNVVDEASLLLKLLQARTQRTGQEWFALDLAMAQPGWDACQYRLQWCGATDRLEHVSMVAHGPAFGQLVPWTAVEAHRMTASDFQGQKS